MDSRNIHLCTLPPMRVATLSRRARHAEEEALTAMRTWAGENDIRLDDGNTRLFGFDNCQPHPNHRYTVWLAVEANTAPAGGISFHNFDGGTYAALRVTGVENISPGWQALGEWLKTSEYRDGEGPGLEEHLSPAGTPLDEADIMLYMPVKG